MSTVIFNGSPRSTGNTAACIAAFVRGAGSDVHIVDTHRSGIHPCKGCLRCNILKYCAIRDDAWGDISAKVLAADTLVFASPVYFHHVSAQMKTVLDRFRSFFHVQLTEGANVYTPHALWRKRFIIILAMGSSDASDAAPVVDLFRFMTERLGSGNSLTTVIAARLAMTGQILLDAGQLAQLYEKLGLPAALAGADATRNAGMLSRCEALGRGDA